MMDSSAVVKAAVKPGHLAVQPGDTVQIQVKMDIDPKWHLYAHEDTTFYGIDLELPPENPLQVIDVIYPAGEEAEFFGETVQILHGQQDITLAGIVRPELTTGEHHLELKLAVQACDDRRCLAPAFIPLAVELAVP
jgi:hypothetical protein